MKFKTHTLGCKVNQYETEAMEEMLLDAGYEKAAPEEVADVYLINTCTVTAMADSKSRQFISRSHRENPEAVLVAAGCYVQVSPEKVEKLPGVDVLIGTKNRHLLVDLIDKARIEGRQNIVESIRDYTTYDALDIRDTSERTRAYMKIQDGCDRFCAYCKIPYARGPVRSRPIEDIVEEAETLARQGFKEIILTGIHIASYGRDTNLDLADVIEAVAEIPGIRRIRTSSMDPMWIREDVLARVAKTKKLCDHFHLSLQSGSDYILKRMNRKYTRDEYLEKTKLLRKYFPNVGITTDIIAGFPGEREEDFQDSLSIIQEARLSRVHVFPYSNRPGTAAVKLKGHLPKKVKRARSKALRKEAARVQALEEDKQIGKVLEVLLEESDLEAQKSYGYATNYFRVEVDSPKMLENEIVRVKITGRNKTVLQGKEV